MQGKKTASGDLPYDVLEFAAKHGLTAKAAEVVLTINGPSKHRCDAAAVAFQDALRQRAQRRPSSLSKPTD
ncbi:hypothetical protein [Mesorhizobium sp. B2-1-3A]|uniref:hypothetical protein n=1 Tax=Mesorhizobium sp. B2-1-3A TaxID=2589971 RepID=UPI001129846D|nr:hypothetical protein [Mesorhizobium sp. B2-1-3A]TPM95037.1 hypothetical protein FJ977_23645 [Mesorhizobium sp. B2-1-3A]